VCPRAQSASIIEFSKCVRRNGWTSWGGFSLPLLAEKGHDGLREPAQHVDYGALLVEDRRADLAAEEGGGSILCSNLDEGLAAEQSWSPIVKILDVMRYAILLDAENLFGISHAAIIYFCICVVDHLAFV
jgi:hypothetical protein